MVVELHNPEQYPELMDYIEDNFNPEDYPTWQDYKDALVQWFDKQMNEWVEDYARQHYNESAVEEAVEKMTLPKTEQWKTGSFNVIRDALGRFRRWWKV